MGTQMTITALINEIEKNRLILPEFQRGYVWTSTQVREYLASLYRGYPTGSFLLWKTPNPGLVRGNPTEDAAFQLILDGQQRLTSIYALVTGNPPPFYEGEELYFNIYFNVVSEEFSYFKKQAMQGSAEWLPVTPFLKAGLGEYLKAGGPVSEEQREFLFGHFNRLQQLDAVRAYTYYLDVLAQRNMEEVVRIFNLVNSKGTRLSKSDLALSHICALWPEARQEMLAAQDEYYESDFWFELDFFVRCTASIATKSGRYEPLYRTTIEEIQSAWRKAKKALDYLINVLRHDAYIDDTYNLPTDLALVPLVVYLAENKGKFSNDKEKRRFLHWFYAALMWARYSGSSETKLDEDLKALGADDPPAKLRDNLIAARGRIKVEASDLEGRGTRSPFYFMCYVVARAAGAVDWFNGLTLYSKLVGKSNGLEDHHIFPQVVLYKKGGYSSDKKADVALVNELANIAFLTKEANLKASDREPAKHLPTVLEQYPNALKRQHVPEKPALWELDRYEDFLADRRTKLARAINTFMERLLKDEEKIEWTIADYISAGESQTVEFKQSLRWNFHANQVDKALEKTTARTIAGFMNQVGGSLVIGVTDDGTISGIEKDFPTLKRHDRDGWEQTLVTVLGEYLSKEIAALVNTSFSSVDGKTIAVLNADAGTKPTFLNDNGSAEFYIRSGNTTQLLNSKQALDYINDHFPS
jgi:hypothetical protein